MSESGIESLDEMGGSGCVSTLSDWLRRLRAPRTPPEPIVLSDETEPDAPSARQVDRPSFPGDASRRTVLQATGGLLATSAIGATARTGRAAHDGVDREEHTILDGTMYETSVHTISSPNEGRTVMIFGGVHGNELGGIEAAHLATDYAINRGTLVVVPEANKAAVDRGNNHGPEGDLNRQFPVGQSPTTDVAAGLWDELLRVDPDIIVDMHTSTTLYQRGSVGQAIFPTSGVVEHAENTVDYLNEEYMNERAERDLPDHAFSVGDPVSKDRPLLIHKAAADRNIAGWLTEVTRIDLNLEEKTFLHDMMTRELLRQAGIDVTSAPANENVV
ncbi:MAG: succinylglutamate desuccinylase/aspartoacylase family protein [Halalkalicoccus sp.]